MRRGAVGMLAGSPTKVGSITVLIAIVAVFLAYNANTGLPFVPTYRVSVLVPDAASLLPGNEVRIGGVRVGQIESTEPVQSAAQCSDPSGKSTPGATCAKVDLKLDAGVNPLPNDSTVIVRARSALGLKYLEIQKGQSTEGFSEDLRRTVSENARTLKFESSEFES